ncbi:MAG: alcohol dehydrogenase catalytic domain-containing protein [Thermoprotei archaeon]
MKALMFEKNGLENLKVLDAEKPSLGSHEVLVKVVRASVNPIDYSTVTAIRNVRPLPHIPGAEFAGFIEKVGDHVVNVKPGDRVIVYNRIFDGTCDMCVSGYEMLCRNGGIIGVISNGGFAEYALVSENNVFKIEDNVDWDIAASLPVGALTSYHAFKQVSISPGDLVVVIGASGNTGIFAVQFAKMMGAKVVAVSRKQWIKDFGADEVTELQNASEIVERISDGKMADVVIDPLGSSTMEFSMKLLGLNGKLITFGALTGDELKVPIRTLYSRQLKLIGSTGGTRRELLDIIKLANDGKFKVKIWKKYNLDQGIEALVSLFSKDRDGKIMITI